MKRHLNETDAAAAAVAAVSSTVNQVKRKKIYESAECPVCNLIYVKPY